MATVCCFLYSVLLADPGGKRRGSAGDRTGTEIKDCLRWNIILLNTYNISHLQKQKNCTIAYCTIVAILNNLRVILFTTSVVEIVFISIWNNQSGFNVNESISFDLKLPSKACIVKALVSWMALKVSSCFSRSMRKLVEQPLKHPANRINCSKNETLASMPHFTPW